MEQSSSPVETLVHSGMQIPYPTKHVFCCACIVSVVALLNVICAGYTKKALLTLARAVCTLVNVNKPS